MRAVVIASTLLAGCSLAFVHGPKQKIAKPLASGETGLERCTTSRLAPAADITIGTPTLAVGSLYLLGAAVGGGGLSAGGGGLSDSEEKRLEAIGGALVLTGAIFIGVAMRGVRIIENCKRARDEAAATNLYESQIDRMRSDARQLTEEARTAAQANDCPRVVQLAQRVFQIDRETFYNVFARDPLIANCAPPRPPITVPPPTEQPVAP